MRKSISRHRLYEMFVQSPRHEIKVFDQLYKEQFGSLPKSLREDFCGTGLLCAEWVKHGRDRTAVGLDLDPDPLAYGKRHHHNRLAPAQQRRMRLLQRDVLKSRDIQADIVAALNFSFWFFHERKQLLRYFRAVRQSMKKRGLFILDTLGGYEAVYEREDERRQHRNYHYYWECEHFNPITHRCRFAIHFRVGRERIQKRVFTYDWRYWTIQETRDILADAGFSESLVLWEGERRDGEGNGVFSPAVEATNDAVWTAYIAALP